MKIALVQMYCPWGERRRTLERIGECCLRASVEGAHLVLFPELTVGGIYKHPEVAAIAEPLDGPSLKFVAKLAGRLGIAVGFGFSERGQPMPFNTYCLLDSSGELAAAYRKNFIPRLERPFWQPGSERPVFELCGRRCAVAICWDATRQELLEHYAGANVELMLMPHAWDSDPLDIDGNVPDYDSMRELEELAAGGRLGGWKTHGQMRDYFYSYIPAASRRYGFASCFVNQAGQPHECLKFVGPSFVADRGGRIVAESQNGQEQIVYARID